jgi:hypothetical protein
MNKDTIKGFNHGTGPIDLKLDEETRYPAFEFRPIEIHLKEDGALGNKPSMCMLMCNLGGVYVYGQLSVEMWNKGLAEIGYKIEKINFDAARFNGGDRINHFFVPVLNQLSKEEIRVLIDSLEDRIRD